MKITESTYKRIKKAVCCYWNHTYYNVDSDIWEKEGGRTATDCRIMFEDLDGRKYGLSIMDGELNAFAFTGRGKWCGSIDMTVCGWDDVMMWLGLKLDEIYRAADALEEELETA